MNRLPQAEAEVMLALWEADGPVPRSWLDQKLSARGWSINTMNTYLTRLEDKGFVSCEKQGRAKVYKPSVAREEYLAFEGVSVLDRLYGKSLKNFVASLVGGAVVDEGELAELRAYLSELKEGNTDDGAV